MSTYTFLLQTDVYRWMVAEAVIPNNGTPNFIQVRSMKKIKFCCQSKPTLLFKMATILQPLSKRLLLKVGNKFLRL